MGSLPDTFDPYWQWLGIAPEQQPPDHYRLLGLDEFVADAQQISVAAERTAARVREKAGDQQPQAVARLLKSIADARRCLIDRRRKAAYDRTLKQRDDTPHTGLRSPPPLPKPRMLDLPPFQPASPPLEPGPPPVEGEPPPPPVPGEPSAQPPPSRSPRPASVPVPPPPGTATDSARSAVGPLSPSPPIPGMPVDEPDPPPVMGEAPPVMGELPRAKRKRRPVIGEPPPVIGEPPPVMGRPATAAGETPVTEEDSAAPPQAVAPPVTPVAKPPISSPAAALPPASPEPPPAPGEEVPPEPAPAEQRPEDVVASRPSPARPMPMPRKKTGPADSGNSEAPRRDLPAKADSKPPVRAVDRAGAASRPQDDRRETPRGASSSVGTGAQQPSPKSRTGVSPAALQKALSPLPAAAKNRTRDGRQPTDVRPDEAGADENARPRRGLPWPIILPAGGAIVALCVGLSVLWGGNGKRNGETAPGPNADEVAAVRAAMDDEGHVAVDRDDEGVRADEKDTDEGTDANSSTDDPSPTEDADTAEATAEDDTADATNAASTEMEEGVAGDGGSTEQAVDLPANENEDDNGPSDTPAAATQEQPEPEPPKPPENPFREFPAQFGFAAALEAAAKAAKDDPIDETAGWVRLAKLPLEQGQQLSVKLLGGKTAIPGDDAITLQREFSLDAGVRWQVNVAQGPEISFPIGWFVVADGQLTFQSHDNQDDTAAEHLQNCLLQLDVAGASHLLALRTPQPAAPILLQLHSNEFQDSIPIPGMPDPGALRLEVVKLLGTGQATRLPPDASAWVGDSVVVDLLDRNRNSPAAIRVICEGARAGRVRFRVTPMGRTAGRGAATMGIQSATLEVSRLQRDKASLNAQLKAIDARIKVVSTQNRELANQMGKAKKPIQTRIRAIDSRVGQLNQVAALLKPLHQKASIQLRVLMRADGHDVLLAGPP